MKNQLILPTQVILINMIRRPPCVRTINKDNEIIPYNKSIHLHSPCRIIRSSKFDGVLGINRNNQSGIARVRGGVGFCDGRYGERTEYVMK